MTTTNLPQWLQERNALRDGPLPTINTVEKIRQRLLDEQAARPALVTRVTQSLSGSAYAYVAAIEALAEHDGKISVLLDLSDYPTAKMWQACERWLWLERLPVAEHALGECTRRGMRIALDLTQGLLDDEQ